MIILMIYQKLLKTRKEKKSNENQNNPNLKFLPSCIWNCLSYERNRKNLS